MAAAQVELNDQLQNGTLGTLNNQTVASMELIRSISWSGWFIGRGLPKSIPSRVMAYFTHLKSDQFGSKAAASYTITTAAGLPYAVILGFSAPAYFNPSSPNKVFLAVGPRTLIDSMSFDQIRLLVEEAGSSVVIDKDGICADANIRNNPTAKMAQLLANFGYCPKP